MAKVDHVADLIHERDRLVDERRRLVGEIDERIAEIEAEIETEWRGGSRVRVSKIKPRRVKSGRRMRGQADALLSMIRNTPTLDYGSVTVALYGEDNAVMRKRLRSSLAYLKRQGVIKNTGKNQWEVLAA